MNRSVTYIKNKGKGVVASILFYSGYYDFLINNFKEKAVILMYHRVSRFAKGEGFRSRLEVGVSMDNFAKQMQYIREKMNPVSLTDLVECIATNKSFPKRAIAITFDDGYEDNYTNAYPILKRYNIPATIFLTTGHIETSKIFWWDKISEIIKKTRVPYIEWGILRNFLKDRSISFDTISLRSNKDRENTLLTVIELFKTLDEEMIYPAIEVLQKELKVADEYIENPSMLKWAQIMEMNGDGIDFGAHTVTHPNLMKIIDGEVKKEIEESKIIIEDKINKPVQGFAYPYGFGQHYNGTIKKMVMDAGFRYACTAENGIVFHNSDLFAFRRITMPNAYLPLSVRQISKYI